jgi:hypothetical protein
MRKSAFGPCIPCRGTKVPDRPEWLHEIKHDGYRLLIQRDGLGQDEEPKTPGHDAGAGCLPMRPFPRGKYLDERRRQSSIDAVDNHMRCPTCGGWIDFSDLSCVVDHAGPLPHPAIDQPQ